MAASLVAKTTTFEDSPADKAKDRKGAKATGVSLKAYEGSAMDQRADAAGQAAMARAAANKAGPEVKPVAQGAQPHAFAHKKPLM